MNEVKFTSGTSDKYTNLVNSENGVDEHTLYFVSKDIETEDGVDFGGTIYKGNDALGTTCADHLKTTAEIKVVGLPDNVQFAGYKNGDTIPAGTSLQDFLMKMLSKELYPNTATKPSIGISIADNKTNLGTFEIGTEVDIPTASMSKSAGKFNASYASPAQPTPSVTWSNETISAAVSGFGSATIEDGTTSISGVKVTVTKSGENKITYSASATYSAPSNSPLTNLGNETTKTSETAADGTATWASASASKNNVTVKATGVYPAYCGLANSINPTVDQVAIASNKIVSTPKDLVVNGPITNQYIYALCPPGWSISSAIDPNGFENIGSFTSKNMTVGCKDGKNQTYTLYIMGPTSQGSDFKMTLKQ
jgi:hypothetical protein